ncbi:biotin--[acetyl-CoA-carboxylase] ligase [Candidatus Hydrogenedentota bacterium]
MPQFDPIDRDSVRQRLEKRLLGHIVLFYDEVDSTNDTLVGLAREHIPDGVVVVAENQRRGQGRQGKPWNSEPGMGLTFSFLLKPRIHDFSTAVSMLAPVAIIQALSKFCSVPFWIKWPNDIFAEGKKISGILIEKTSDNDVIVGIGININQEINDFDRSIREAAGSLRMLAGDSCDRTEVLIAVLRAFEKYYVRLAGRGNQVLQSEWERLSCVTGKRVRIESGTVTCEGLATGFTETGGLVLELDDGEISEFATGSLIFL